MSEPQLPQAAVIATLQRWHAMIDARDLSRLPELLHPQAVFRSPMAFKPYEGAALVNLILNTVIEVFEAFTYHRELSDAGGSNWALEFSARVEGREIKGIDLIRFDDAGLITEFEVMVRPMSGLQALGTKMAQRLAPGLEASENRPA